MSSAANVARFDWVEYQGIEKTAAPAAGQYANPILAGFYPDPSIVKVGADFYLVNSTFSLVPGIPVWHSRDLVHWRQIGNAIDRPGQLNFGGLGMSKGVFAPAISHHKDRFYIVNTCVDCGGNFVITARDPKGPWSDPVWLKDVGGIDPSLFFDPDGGAWLVNNDVPKGTPRYDGHRAIWLHRFDPETLRTTGEAKMIVDGGVDPAAKPIWIEGPHLFKKDGVYYLMAAEGGTSDRHSEVIFRADRVDGPYVPAPAGVNPILTQRDLDPARPQPVTSSGHADLVQLDDGNWWAVFLATRPYEGGFYNTGRETFLLPVSWANGWPTILPHGTAVPQVAKAPALPAFAAPPTTGSFVARDDFTAPKLAPYWMVMRSPAGYSLGGGALQLQARPERIGDGKSPSFVARRQQNAEAIVTTAVNFAPADGEEAGLAAVQNDNFFLAVGLTREGGKLAVRVSRRAGGSDPITGVTVASKTISSGPIRLRVHARGGRYDFDYATASGPWQPVAHDVDATNLSTATAGGFVGTLIGPYAQSGTQAAR
ncbi:glycoside hydrolase family 43 protein [Sphingomonas sp.]|uniref:glycoside hydrolase family 43 protein n=1 Tax=Sphingomonas sp. TaxID=28214 RepID=UPI003B3ABEA4